jgi:hypothetical protein
MRQELSIRASEVTEMMVREWAGGGEIATVALPPAQKILNSEGKTLGQVAMEADRQNVKDDPRMVKARHFAGSGYVPEWKDLTQYQKDQWERFALKIAKAIVEGFASHLVESVKIQMSQDKPLPAGPELLKLKGK